MDRIEKAEELFRSGCNCSQSVFAAFADELGLDEEERGEFRDGKAPVCDRMALEAAGVPAAVIRLG